MKPKEFYEILERFVEEDKYWRALKFGDIIYEEVPREIEFDYHKMQIDSIDVDERTVYARDVSGSGIPYSKKLSCFLTEAEFKKL